MRVFSEHHDILLFLGVLVFGVPVLLPAVYASTQGFLDPRLVFVAVSSALIFGDTLWYTLGVRMGEKIGEKFPFLTRSRKVIGPLRDILRKHPFRIVFLSRFTYGTKIATNVASGVERIHFPIFVSSCAGSTFLWVALMYALSYAIGNVDLVSRTLRGIGIGLLLLSLLVLGVMLVVRRYGNRYL